MKQGIGFVFVLLLLTQCKVNQGSSDKGIPDDENYIGFYSKKNGTTVRLYQNGFSCLKGSPLKSFQYNLPRLIREDLKLEQFDLEVTPFVKDSSSCEGLYIYRTFIGGRTPRSLNGMPYHFCAINGNNFLFFNKDDTEGNRKKLDAFKGEPIYSGNIEVREEYFE